MAEPSKTWQKAYTTEVAGKGDSEQSRIYAEEMHRRLCARGIANKMVTYRFTAYYRGPLTVTQTAVIYRDETTPKYPSWMVSNLTTRPIWLPNGTVEEQVCYAEARPVEIIEILEPGMKPASMEKTGQPGSTASGKWETRFRDQNGTEYDPLSPVDRRKMAALKAGYAKASKSSKSKKS